MMPMTLARHGEVNAIKKVGGTAETRRYLGTLGFVVGSAVTVISALGGHLIVNVRGSRVALSHEVASKILV